MAAPSGGHIGVVAVPLREGAGGSVESFPVAVWSGWAARAGRLAAVAVPVMLFAEPSPVRAHDATLLAAVVVVWAAVQRFSFGSTQSALGTGLATVFATGVALIVVVGSAQLLGAEPLGGISLFEAAAAIVLLSVAWERVTTRYLAGRQRVLILGPESVASAIAEETQREKHSRFEVVGVVCDAEDVPDAMTVAGAPLLGSLEGLGDVVETQRPDLIVLANGDAGPAVDRLLETSWRRFRVVGVSHFFEDAFGRVPIEHITPAWFMSILHFRQRGYGSTRKRVFDLVLGGVIFVLVLPIALVIAASVRLSGTPMIYHQRRVGERGETFEMLKFRTMIPTAEADGQATWAAANDARVTKVGRVLRRTHLDELPQLCNVLHGEMSLVGPRPERPEFVQLLEDQVPYWSRRLLLKPGLTGWAQLHSGYADNCDATAHKLSYDLWYLRHRTLLLDIAIVAKTVVTVASGAGSR